MSADSKRFIFQIKIENSFIDDVNNDSLMSVDCTDFPIEEPNLSRQYGSAISLKAQAIALKLVFVFELARLYELMDLNL